MFLNSFELFLLEFFVMFCIIFLLILGIYFDSIKGLVSVLKLLQISIILIFFCFLIGLEENFLTFTFNHQFFKDGFTISLRNFFILIYLLFLILSLSYYLKEGIYSYEILLLIFLSFLGMILLFVANDFLSLFLSLELQSLSFYILACYKRFTQLSTEAGLKYFILGSFSSGLLLFGISLIYGLTGTCNFNDLFILLCYFSDQLDFWFYYGLHAAFLFILAGFYFKLGIFPFHIWIPDVYQGSPTLITFFFALLPKLVLGILLIKILYYSGIIYYFDLFSLMLLSGFLSILTGSLGAFYQKDIKRLLAYGAISHLGFFLVGLSFNTFDGLVAGLFYLIVYLFLTFGTFVIVFLLRNFIGLTEILDLSKYSMILRSNPLLGLSFSLILFSLAGVPPLSGFFNKFFIISAAMDNELFFLTFFIVLFSLLSAVYYIRLIKIMYFEVPSGWITLEVDNSFLPFFLSIIVLFNIFFMFFFSFFYLWTEVLFLRIL